jgi:hypothetical protein
MKQRKQPVDPRSLDVRAVLDKWVARSRWWSEDERRIYVRLHTARGILEIYRTGRQWYMSRIAD